MSYSTEVSADSPLYWFKFDETSGSVVNSGSRSTAGTVVGTGVTRGITGPGLFKAASFNGSGEISLPTTEPDFSTNNYTFTYEAWVAFDTTQVSTYPTIVRRDGNGIATLLRGRGPAVGASFSPNIYEGYVSGANPYATTTVMDGVWRHLVMVKSSTSLTLYTNGVYDNGVVGATNGTLLGGAMGFTVGGSNGNTDERFKGKLAQVAIYSQALSADRIAAHYSAGLETAPQFRGWGIPL